ncbi:MULTISPECIES: PRC-barrel domain-containing protein [Prochlorococcus]|uniref:RNA metabolism-related protein n=1 Tax=Prochlorococcus marinus str. MIT 9116 TaxID=167544 RepID=A0A0A1ZWU8_PROMR|nr:PRC-barrel domain-containing protein [Prochlorococcus marinus]KGF89440.1 RNA metabolism-related protein [Prochlorococcus marinus str. MIT 9107]KGF92603.1 RNA metabolism-related protein [Prochlorococcus marinus str. MIT 9116]KGF95691.1 RNA metabolism-related protein [Prochlorococcus marinus str. MIT 9123]
MKLPKEILLSQLLTYNVKGNISLNYGNGENVWMHPPVHRILGWYTRPSNFDLQRNVWRLNQISQIIDNEIYVKGDPAISDLGTLNRFPTLIQANLININGSKIGVIADFLFDMKTGRIKYYLVSRSNPNIPGSSRWKLEIENINDQQPGLVFCESNSLDDLSLIKSSLKNEFLQKGKKIIGRFDDMKNIASNRLEHWLEEDEDINQNLDFEQKSFYNDERKSISFRDKNEDDPWI